ncbi:efflux transporter, RND family, MFP subunit [Oryzomicrobium terrae]|uniref:Efflux transporter, RND family, MFP subunit n=1 Tax=Oryzomicrobium terrae TaxID=1735038 RepID=A0A5C1E971_9RHOO|nr:HlyD family efflux transporter periplasmic adaptor subunit [Oryzomicrobium terrae]QEL65204.1 efflux transporter, RND family, MFP subunit [Oryzomicrobium terrae]
MTRFLPHRPHLSRLPAPLSRRRRARGAAAPLAALLALALAALLPVTTQAHEGHDDAPPPAVRGDAPQRLPDGSVFLPKPSQRQLGLRTVVAQPSAQPQSVELPGRVVLDPSTGGRVQAMIAGRIEPPAGGLPALGEKVRRGQLLAAIHPSASALELGNQAAQAADFRAQLKVAEKRLARLQSLEATVARKDIEQAEAEVQSLKDRLATLSGSLRYHEELRAPVAGVVATANAIAGQVVDARETLFEIVDPAGLRIEALTFDPRLAARIATASASPAPGESLALRFVGAGRALREQAVPLQFRVDAGPETGTAPVLALGQTVTVLAQTRDTVTGAPVPAAALVKNPANQDVVWVKTGAERFVPRPVRFVPLDGARVTLTDGVAAGERVVVQGATLLNQVR